MKLNTLILKTLEDVKAQDIVTLDVRGLTDIADFMVICTGTSNRQVSAMTDRLVEAIKAAKLPVGRVEGQELGEWVVVDLGNVLVHLMQDSARRLYQLETLWAPRA